MPAHYRTPGPALSTNEYKAPARRIRRRHDCRATVGHRTPCRRCNGRKPPWVFSVMNRNDNCCTKIAKAERKPQKPKVFGGFPRRILSKTKSKIAKAESNRASLLAKDCRGGKFQTPSKKKRDAAPRRPPTTLILIIKTACFQVTRTTLPLPCAPPM